MADQQELNALSSVLREEEFEPVVTVSAEEAKRCETILTDIRSGQRVTALRALFETDDRKDPRLKEYEDCSNPEIWTDGNDTKRGAFLGLKTIGDMNYRLYRLTQPAANEGDEVLFAESGIERQEFIGRGGFYVVNSSTCMIEGGVPLPRARSAGSVKSRHLHALSVLLLHDGHYYVANLEDVSIRDEKQAGNRSTYRLHLFKFHSKAFAQVCSWKQAKPASGK